MSEMRAICGLAPVIPVLVVHDVATARGPHRRRNPGLENQVAERAHPLGRRTFIHRTGPGVEGDEVDLGGDAGDQLHEPLRVRIRIVHAFQHDVFEGDAAAVLLVDAIGPDVLLDGGQLVELDSLPVEFDEPASLALAQAITDCDIDPDSL